MSIRSRKPLPNLDAPPLPRVKSLKPPGQSPQTPLTAPRIVCAPDAAGARPAEVAPVDGLNTLPTPARGLPDLTDAMACWALARS